MEGVKQEKGRKKHTRSRREHQNDFPSTLGILGKLLGHDLQGRTFEKFLNERSFRKNQSTVNYVLLNTI